MLWMSALHSPSTCNSISQCQSTLVPSLNYPAVEQYRTVTVTLGLAHSNQMLLGTSIYKAGWTGVMYSIMSRSLFLVLWIFRSCDRNIYIWNRFHRSFYHSDRTQRCYFPGYSWDRICSPQKVISESGITCTDWCNEFTDDSRDSFTTKHDHRIGLLESKWRRRE